MELYCQIKFFIAVVSVVKMSFFQAEDWLVSEDAIEVSMREKHSWLSFGRLWLGLFLISEEYLSENFDKYSATPKWVETGMAQHGAFYYYISLSFFPFRSKDVLLPPLWFHEHYIYVWGFCFELSHTASRSPRIPLRETLV